MPVLLDAEPFPSLDLLQSLLVVNHGLLRGKGARHNSAVLASAVMTDHADDSEIEQDICHRTPPALHYEVQNKRFHAMPHLQGTPNHLQYGCKAIVNLRNIFARSSQILPCLKRRW